MKKITSALLAILMLVSVFTLSSCFKKETPESLVNGALEKLNGHSAIESDILMEIEMDMMGMSLSIPMDINTKVINPKSDNPTSSTNLTVSVFGVEVVTETYTENGWTYVISEGESYKTNNAELEDSFGVGDLANSSEQLDAELFEGVEIIENEDGTKSVELTIPDDMFTEQFADAFSSVTESLGTGADAKVTDVNVKYTVKDGELAQMVMSFNLEMTVEGISTTASAVCTIDYVAYDDEVKITLPEGYESFPEIEVDDELDIE